MLQYKEEGVRFMKLNRSEVVFNEIEHTYTLGERQLSGITSMLSRQLFADKYADIPKDMLDAAAAYGSAVHADIELYDSLGIGSDLPHVESWAKLKKRHQFEVLDSEYLVSDNEHVASSIDIVLSDYSLADIKTTSRLDEEYLSWQLSCYAYLFELQNPCLRVPQLYAVWLPKKRYGKAQVIEIKRKSDSEVAALIEADRLGEQYVPTMPVAESSQIIAADAVAEVIRVERELKILKEKETEIRSGLLELMRQYDMEKFETEGLTLTRKMPTQRESIDTKALKERYPDIYAELLTQTEIKETLLIKI